MSPPRRHAERVYHELKRQLIGGVIRLGDRLDVATLADSLDVSATPVREALNRLCDEQLVAFVQTKGFVVKIPDEAEIRDLYSWNAILADVAATVIERVPRQPAIGRMSVPAEVSLPMADHQTATFFITLAAGFGNAELVRAMGNNNDRLARLRSIERDLVLGGPTELERLDALHDAGDTRKLRQGLARYHQRRLQRIADLHRELLSQSFSGRRPGERSV